MSIKNLEIKPSEAKAVEVASLPTRPTSSATYGGRGLTAQQMKAAYDAYPALIKERFNALIADLLSGSALEDIHFTIPTHDPFGTGIESTVKAYLEYIGKILDFANDSTDDSYKTLHEFVNTVVNDMANATTLEYSKETRVLKLTIGGFEKEVTIEVDKYEKAIQKLTEDIASLEARKFDKVGGGIVGDVNIGGSVYIGKDLTVAGNSTIQEAGHLKIKDAVIITNSDGKKLAVLSGLAIRKGENDTGVDETYGIMYDFASNSVKLGLIYTDENGNYQFLAGEGQPVATRADSAELAEHGIALWDAANHRFIAKDMTDIDFTYGDVMVDYNTTDGMSINGQARFTYNGGTTKDVTMDIEVPIVAGDGVTVDKVDGQEKVEVKLDKAFTDMTYVAKTTESNLVYATGNSGQPENTHFAYNPAAWDITKFDGTGCLRTNDPTGDDQRQCINKRYADKNYLQKQTTTAKGHSFVYAYDRNGDRQFLITGSYLADTIAYRGTGGRLQVGTPAVVFDAVNLQYANKHYLALTGGTITGSLTIAQDLIVQGKTTSKDVENLAVKENLITLAKDNTAALTAPAGMMVPKYNGTESGALVFDDTGTAYVGDIVLNEDGNISFPDSDLQPLATRGTLVGGEFPIWDEDNLTFVGSGKNPDDYVAKLTPPDQFVYAYGYSENTPVLLKATSSATANQLAYRDSNGNLKVGTPVEENDATPRKYVDTKFAQIYYPHHITITNENYGGMLLMTLPLQSTEPIANFTELRTSLNKIGKPIMATGYLHNKSETSAPTVTISGIEYDSTEQVINALVTYQTFTLTDQTITATTTPSVITIQEDGLWSFTDVVM